MRDDLYEQLNEKEEHYWWHIGRRKLVLEMLKKFFWAEKREFPARTLDLGCGTGIMMQELKPYGKIWGLDSNAKALHYCREKKAGDFLFKTDLEQKLPFKKDYFDIILCMDVLEHTKKEHFVLSEARRVLKRKGYLIIMVPSYQWFFSYWDKVAGHYRRNDSKSLKIILQQTGFRTEKISYFNLFALLPAIIFRSIKSGQKLAIKDFSSDFVALPGWLNNFFLFLSRIERILINFISLPAGLSLLVVARKEHD